MEQGWLFTVETWQAAAEPGDGWRLWTEPPISHDTGQVRRRRDGDPYTPAWKPGDGIVIYHPQSERCVALLEITSHPDWSEDDGVFYLDSVVIDWHDSGPTLAEIGVERALQGGRHRLTPTQYWKASKAFSSR